MSRNFDLLGDPIPENHGNAGANGHIATKENVNKVRVLLASGKEKKEIAKELGISIPTLTKHYFHSGAKSLRDARRRALADERAKNMLRLDQAAAKGNVSAIKEYMAILDAEAMKERAREAAGENTGKDAKPAKPVTPGKKAKQISDARNAIEQDDLLNPRVH